MREHGKGVLAIVVITLPLVVGVGLLTGFQAGGYGAIQTTAEKVFTNESAPGTSSIVRNVGQSSHWLQYCTTGTVTSMTIQLEESPDGNAPWNPISQVGQVPTDASKCATLEAGGYFPNVRANLLTIAGGGSITAWYSGSSAPIPGSGTIVGAKYAVPTVPPIYQASLYSQAFAAVMGLNNPGASAVDGLLWNPGTNAKSLYVQKILVNSTNSSIGSVRANIVSNAGTCTAASGINALKVTNAASNSVAAIYAGCSVTPTGKFAGDLWQELVGSTVANVQVDSEGLIIPPGNGIMVQNVGAVTGAVNVEFWWFEQ